MEIALVFKIAGTGVIVAVLNEMLIRSGREDRQISDLFVLIKALFEL